MAGWNLIIYAPAYNVEKPIGELLERAGLVATELGKEGVSLESFIIVEDGSRDNTLRVLEGLKSRCRWLDVIAKGRNEGPVKALFDGMARALSIASERGYAADRTIVARMDTDLEHQPEDLLRLVEPITSGSTNMVVGYIPYDERSGQEAIEFNLRAGLEESRKFLGADIPQFCPGFNAIRLDFFNKIHIELVAEARKYEREMKEDMLAMDFVMLVIAKDLGWKPEIIRLRPIEDKWIKKPAPEKMRYYLSCHERIMRFLEKS